MSKKTKTHLPAGRYGLNGCNITVPSAKRRCRRSARLYAWVVVLGVTGLPLRAQTPDPASARTDRVRTQPVGKLTDHAGRDAAARKRFKDDLTGAVLTGTWQMTMGGGISKPVVLSDPQPESYRISRVEEAAEDYWVITARIKYADKDVEVPVLVRVIWSGDTPIITVDNLSLPLIGTYSARVMIYKGFYAGTWFGTGYGGVLSGRIMKAPERGAMKPKAPPQGRGVKKGGAVSPAP